MAEISKEELFKRYGSGIEFVFKGNDPFIKHVDYDAPLGVLIANEEGKVLCYECKQWYESISAHVHQGHKMNISDYREKFGFNKGAGLVSRKLSKKIAEKNLERNSVAAMQEKIKENKKDWQVRLVGPKKTMQKMNATNTCPAQYKERYTKICRETGKLLGREETKKLDAGIVRHFQREKSWIDFRDSVGQDLGMTFQRKKPSLKTCCGSRASRHRASCPER